MKDLVDRRRGCFHDRLLVEGDVLSAWAVLGLRYDGPRVDPDYTHVLFDAHLLTPRDFAYTD